MTSLSDKAGFLIVANLVKYAVGFVMPMVLVRMLSQSEYGTYQQMILILTTVTGVVLLGLPTSVYYFFHHVPPERLPALMAQTTLMLTIAGLIACIGIYLSADMIAAAINNPDMVDLLKICGLATFFMLASEHSVPFMIAQNRYVTAVVFEVTETFARVALLLAPLWLGFGFEGLIVGIVVYALLRFLIRNWYLFATSHLHFSGWTKHAFPREQLAYGVPIALGTLSMLIGGAVNRGLVAANFSPAHYAIYAVGALEIPLDVIFQASVANVLRASLPPLVRDGNLTEVVRLIREAVRKLSIIVLPSFIFLYGYSFEFITVLFTPEYEESVRVFQIYLWFVPLHMFVLSPVPQVFGHTKANLYIPIAMAVFLVVGSYLFLEISGFYGPAIAAAVTSYVGVLAYLLVVVRLTKATFFQLTPVVHIGRVILVALGALLGARLADDLTSSGLLNLILAGTAFSAIFLTVALILGVFTANDRNLMRRWIAKVLPFLAPKPF